MRLGPLSLSLRQLQYVVAVAEELSFRGAATRCMVSQPSLSAQIAEIESALGVRLFERDKRRVLVTAAGRDVARRSKEILVHVEDLVSAAKSASDPLLGTLRIGVIPTISPYLLPIVTPHVRERFEKLTVTWLEEKTSVLAEKLREGSLDAAIVAVEADLGEVEIDVLADDPFFVVAAPTHPLARKKSPLVTRELNDVPMLLLDEGHCFREQALAYCEKAKAPELEFRATSLSTLVQMVAGGAAITLLPSLALATEVRRAELVVRAFAKPAPHRTIALVWRKRSPLREALKKIAKAMRESYPKPKLPRRLGPTL